MADDGERPARLCLGPRAALRQGRRRLGRNEQSCDFGRGTPASFTSISNTTSSGYTAGFGVEWAFSSNWSARAEYAYIGLPSQSFTVAPGTSTFGGDVITFSNRNISMVTGAVNYKFGGW